MILTSPRFQNGQSIPELFTGEGENLSPPLRWTDVPERTRSFAIICDDPDAPVRAGKDHPFVHWVIYGLKASTRSLPKGLPREEVLQSPITARQGRNSFGGIGYGGPMPPVGHGPHHYRFTLYALESEIALAGGATKAQLLQAIVPRLIAQTSLVGTYERFAEVGPELSGKIERSPRAPNHESGLSP